jgi:uncharacterized membrane protein
VDLGPVELIVLEFPGNQFNGDVAPALAELVDQGTVRVIDLVFILKDADGDVEALELSGVEDAVRAPFEALLDADDGLLSEEDVEDVADVLEPNSSALMILFEHRWADRFQDAVIASGGQLIGSLRIPADAVEAALAAQS